MTKVQVDSNGKVITLGGKALVAGEGSTLITKNITQNGTYNASSDNADGYSSVSVNVAGTTPTGTLNITANGVYDVTNYASVDVSVSGSGGSGGGGGTLYAWVFARQLISASVIAYTVSELPSAEDNVLVLDKTGMLFGQGLNWKVILSVNSTGISIESRHNTFVRNSSYDLTL